MISTRLTCLGFLIGLALAPTARADEAPRRNVVFILADDKYLQCEGED